MGHIAAEILRQNFHIISLIDSEKNNGNYQNLNIYFLSTSNMVDGVNVCVAILINKNIKP